MGEREKKRRRQQKQIRLEEARRIMGKSSWVLPPDRSFKLAKSAEKMSEVLAEFAEPLFQYTHDEEKICSVAVIAWNASLLPREERRGFLEKAAEFIPASDPEARDGLKTLLATMILRKLERYPNNQRLILGYDLVESGEERVLNVVPTHQPDKGLR